MLRILSAAIALFVLVPASFAQSTSFTYQGQLISNGEPASGPHDIRVKLFGAATDGGQLATTQCLDDVQMSNGQFTISLDFGQQFATTSPRFLEIDVRADAGQSCSDGTGYTTLSPRQQLSAIPLATHAASAFALDAPDGAPTSAVFVDDQGRVGIGTTSPGASVNTTKLDVRGGALLVSNLGDQADLLWLESERSWVFRQQGTGVGTSLMLASIGGGGNKNFLIQTDGNVGIGTTTPSAKLHVAGSLLAGTINCSLLTASSRVVVDGSSSGGPILEATNRGATSGTVGFLGATTDSNVFLQNMIGVRGSTASGASNSFGVFATGRLGASGTKSFRIDHPDDPTNAYLFHYSTESPEVINFYRGSVVLDAHGNAVVMLPAYFAKINTNPSYQLTPIGAAMPMLHVSKKIDPAALAKGATAGPGVVAPDCWFEIAGGQPGGEVSWRVEAVRNDEFVRRFGAPVEVEKLDRERGTLSLAP